MKIDHHVSATIRTSTIATIVLFLSSCNSSGASHDAAPRDSAIDQPDSVPCSGTVQLGGNCGEDCDCTSGLSCRGLPGAKVCSISCLEWQGCEEVEIGCDTAHCDLNVQGCRCPCEEATCNPGHCTRGYCVGCSQDDHCAHLDCPDEPGLDRPRCQLDTESCVCGGECGDGVCDEAEASLDSCPADCPGPCIDGAVLPFACKTGELVPWCECQGEQWQCDDPTPLCPGENSCLQHGGHCVDSPDQCAGVIAGTNHGCTDECCLPTECSGPGGSFYPDNVSAAICCPGLRALSSYAPMEGFQADLVGISCVAGCWSRTCAPCGDGTCQLHFGENPCNCSEDCPYPPEPFICKIVQECGIGFCRQEGTVCQYHAPDCQQESCSWTTTEHPGWICDPTISECRQP